MKLTPLQKVYKEEGRAVLGQLNTIRWGLAYHAMRGKQAKLESWAEILSDLARVEERTVREWAQAAEFRELVFFAIRRYPKLPYSFFAHASRKLDTIPTDKIIDLMLTYEADEHAKLTSFDAQLNALAGPELPDYGGFPPSGYPIDSAIKDELSRIAEIAERPDTPAPVAGLLRAAGEMIGRALEWFGQGEAVNG